MMNDCWYRDSKVGEKVWSWKDFRAIFDPLRNVSDGENDTVLSGLQVFCMHHGSEDVFDA